MRWVSCCSPPCYDTLAATQLTLKSRYMFRKLSDCGLKTLVPELLGVELPSYETVTGGKYFDELPSHDSKTIRYACADSDFALRLYHRFNAWFAQYLPEHRALVGTVESPTAVYCGLMKYNGLLMDKTAMIRKQVECMDKLLDVRHKIRDLIGDVDIGANAGTQAFKRYLFEDLKLRCSKQPQRARKPQTTKRSSCCRNGVQSTVLSCCRCLRWYRSTANGQSLKQPISTGI